jgi:hypothetical protein
LGGSFGGVLTHLFAAAALEPVVPIRFDILAPLDVPHDTAFLAPALPVTPGG